jgi:hypothetical protein
MRFFGGEKEKPSEEPVLEREPTEAEKFRDKISELFGSIEGSFDASSGKSGIYGGYFDSPEIAEPLLEFLKQEGYVGHTKHFPSGEKMRNEDLQGTFPENGIFIVFQIADDEYMIRVGLRKEHLLSMEE